jgi:hypothetical protein
MPTAAEMRARHQKKKQAVIARRRGGRVQRFADGGFPADPEPTAADIDDHILDYNRAERGKFGESVARGVSRMPGLMAGAMLDMPRQAMEQSEILRMGEDYNPGPVLGAALTPMTGAMPFAARNAVGVFGGRLAATADKAALAKAEQMAAAGANRGAIWNDTGWFQDARGNWNFEIPDEALRVSPGRGKGLTSGPIEHPDVAAAYPQLSEMTTVVRPDAALGGAYFAKSGVNQPVPHILSGNTRSVSAHELQHAIDDIEGHFPGLNRSGGPEKARDVIDQHISPRDWESFTNEQRAQAAVESYKRLMHETKARNVQSRLDMTPEQRATTPPYLTEDRPRAAQIEEYDPLSLQMVTRDMFPQVKASGGRVQRFADGGFPADLEPTATDLYAHMSDYDRAQQGLDAQRTARAVTRMPGLMVNDSINGIKNALDESERLRTTGEYDPGPVMSAAMMPMTGAFPFAARNAVGAFGGHLPTYRRVPGNEGMPDRLVHEVPHERILPHDQVVTPENMDNWIKHRTQEGELYVRAARENGDQYWRRIEGHDYPWEPLTAPDGQKYWAMFDDQGKLFNLRPQLDERLRDPKFWEALGPRERDQALIRDLERSGNEAAADTKRTVTVPDLERMANERRIRVKDNRWGNSTAKPENIRGKNVYADGGPVDDWVTPSGADDWVTPAQKDIGQAAALKEGLKAGATAGFSDELEGAYAASGARKMLAELPKSRPSAMGSLVASLYGAGKLGYEYLTGQPGEATKEYQTARDEARTAQKAAQEQYPKTFLAGDVGGALTFPAGAALKAPSLLARMGRSAGVGAGYGALSGAGHAETMGDVPVQAGTGAVVGGATGFALPVATELVRRGGNALLASQPVQNARNAVHAAFDTDSEAARRIVSGIQRDIETDPAAVARMAPREVVDNIQSGGPASIIDMGGQSTRALAKSATNTSPEARTALTNLTNDRFKGQGIRLSEWFNSNYNYPDADAIQSTIEMVRRTVNRPAYEKAYKESAKTALWDRELEDITQAPVVQNAIRIATPQLRNWSVLEGFKPPIGAFDLSGGKTVLKQTANGNTILPSLQYWDYVKRGLDQIGTPEARVFSKTLRDKLDEMVPSYKNARAGAAQFFRAEDALEAGQNFVSQNFGLPGTKRALAAMSPQERKLFQDGFVSRFIETLDKTGYRRDILNSISQSPAATNKLQIALGPQKASELEAALRVERLMDLSRKAVQGGSPTAQYLSELGLAGGVYGAGSVLTWDPKSPWAFIPGILAGAGARTRNAINQKLSRRVGELLASNDISKLREGIRLVSRNPSMMDSLRKADAQIARIGAQQAPVPMLQAPATGRADEQQ